jgi:hypothetical protein
MKECFLPAKSAIALRGPFPISITSVHLDMGKHFCEKDFRLMYSIVASGFILGLYTECGLAIPT